MDRHLEVSYSAIVAVDGYRIVPFVAAAGSCSADFDLVVGDENHYAAAVCAEDNSDSGTSTCHQRQDYHNVKLVAVAAVVVVADAALLLVASFADVVVVAAVVAASPVVVAAPAAAAV